MASRISEGRPVFVYYAHPVWLYNTPQEEEAIEFIRDYFGKKEDVVVINPKEYDEIYSFKMIKTYKGMAFCLCLVDMADFLVFQRFPLTEDFERFIENYIVKAENYYKEQMPPRIGEEICKLRELLKQKAVLTPGVVKEVNHALKKSIPVYEITDKKVKPRRSKLHEDILPPDEDTLYRTVKKLVEAFNAHSEKQLHPPFWWL
jgi:hypothetical protein